MSSKNADQEMQDKLVTSLQILDPLLQFLTKATGRPIVPLQSLRAVVPSTKSSVLSDIPKLTERGVLLMEIKKELKADIDSILVGSGTEKDKDVMIGFPLPCPQNFSGDEDYNSLQSKKGVKGSRTKLCKIGGGLHGSTKAAAKRRMSALRKTFKIGKAKDKTNGQSKEVNDAATLGEGLVNTKDNDALLNNQLEASAISSRGLNPALLDGMVHTEKYHEYSVKEQLKKIGNKSKSTQKEDSKTSKEAQEALKQLEHFFQPSRGKGGNTKTSATSSSQTGGGKEAFILPRQAAYAGSREKRPTQYGFLSQRHIDYIPISVREAFGLQLLSCKEGSQKTNPKKRRLYSHQAEAIGAALDHIHTLVCTGTGSGKSLCFLLPILADVMNSDIASCNDRNDSILLPMGTTALMMFPTKALAQDQLVKLQNLINLNPMMQEHIRPGVIDGDTPHQNRGEIAKECNIILSNPDTLHAALLPGWKGIYRDLLARLRYVVIDELHTYEGAFGAHVSLVLSRLARLRAVANLTSSSPLTDTSLVFIGCSATIGHPEDHFRLICPIAKEKDVKVLSAEEDGSPCAVKHFFVWNPPLLDTSGGSIGHVIVPKKKNQDHNKTSKGWKRKRGSKSARARNVYWGSSREDSSNCGEASQSDFPNIIKRKHPADETAHLLAHAVRNSIRTIAFCKTRMLAEWVYESCISILKSEEDTSGLLDKVEVYRGGYCKSIRRSIEARLFRNELFGVVGTSALELGIDLGGIDLTLHCGYPGSIASLMQQAGRAGRGAQAQGASFAIMVCFSSPAEQHIWRHPKGLLGRGLDAPPSIPLNVGIVQGHLLCASNEFPLCGDASVSMVLDREYHHFSLADFDLFGGEETYRESFERLYDGKQIEIKLVNDSGKHKTYAMHPSIGKPSSRVSLRSIEPIHYSIVDLSHPQQGNRNDGIHDKAAIMDTIPYSRVFYHAYPGAIIMHRGRRYKIHSMNAPPALASTTCSYGYNSNNLGAYAKPTTARYSTRALSITLITVVKQIDRVEIQVDEPTEDAEKKKKSTDGTEGDQDFEKGIGTTSMIDDKEEDESGGNSSGKSERDEKEQKPRYNRQDDFVPPLASGTLAGTGVVTVKRTVHGYKKLSLVNRVELSRSEISLPPMEYDTNAIWIDTEASILAELMPADYDKGVHALSHAIVAVAPLFVPCTPSDIDCDHSHYDCTRVTLFDVRAGGAGTSSQLWKHFFKPGGVLEAAIDLLIECPSSCDTGGYKGGCPGCIQSVPCINFHEDLSRKAALIIGRRMLARVKYSDLYIQNSQGSIPISIPENELENPRRKKRLKALRTSHDLLKKSIVVGRPSWPTDNSSTPNNRSTVEPCDTMTGTTPTLNNLSSQGGFLSN